MIQWLEVLREDDVVKANIERFRRTSFAKDLEEDKSPWVWVSWPRSPESPLRFELRSDPNRKATFTIDGDGREYGRVTPS
jgi:hypothetical protein